jgi:hypothetical protein
MKIIGYVIFKNDELLKTGRGWSSASTKLYSTENRAKAVVKSRYDPTGHKVMPVYIFESDLEE